MELKELAIELNQSFKGLEAKHNALDNNVKALEKAIKENGTKPEYEKALKDNADAIKGIEAKMKQISDQADQLEASLKRVNSAGEKAKGLAELLRDQVNDREKDLLDVRDGKRASVKLDIKADMTIGSNFTNDVIPMDYFAGVHADPLRSVHIRQFLNVTATRSNLIAFNQETANTDGTGATAEGSAASQSDNTITQQEAPVRKINTYYTLSKEMLADAPLVANWIRTRTMGRLMNKEDQQLLYGTGVAPQISGISISGNFQAYTDQLADSNASRYDVLANAVINATVDEYRPNLILVHPNDFLKIQTTKDSQGNYILPQIFTGQPIRINGAVVLMSTAVTADDFFVGDFFMGATFAIRSGIEVTVTNSNASNFTKGLVDVLVEERVALPIHNPNAFVYDNFSDTLGLATG